VVGNAIVDYAPTAVRTGYTFEGWYYDDTTFANELKTSDVVSDADTLYANWTVDGS
jgi:uncharacterized repeat protein (TIGR02543 family)